MNAAAVRQSFFAVVLLMAAGCGDAPRQADAPRVWRFAIEESEGSVQHAYALEFKRRVEAASDGEVDVVVYPYGALGTSTQITEQLNLGALEFAMASPGSIGKFIPETQVFLLHFVLTRDDELNQRVLASPRLLEAFDSLYADKGLKLLSIFPEGEMVWTTQEEVRRPEDFRGVKMRVMTTPILLDAYNAYGANATPLPYSEVYSALQLGMIDAQVNPVFAIERQKFHEVTNWLIFPAHAHFVTTAAANRDFFASLPPAEQELVETTIRELNGFIFERQREYQIERLKKIIRDKIRRGAELNVVGDLSGFVQSLTSSERAELIDDNDLLNLTGPLTAEERNAFLEASRNVRETYLRIGGPRAKDMLELVLEEAQRARDKAASPGVAAGASEPTSGR